MTFINNYEMMFKLPIFLNLLKQISGATVAVFFYPPHSAYPHAAAGGVGGHGSISGGRLVGWLVESARFSGLWRFPGINRTLRVFFKPG